MDLDRNNRVSHMSKGELSQTGLEAVGTIRRPAYAALDSVPSKLVRAQRR